LAAVSGHTPAAPVTKKLALPETLEEFVARYCYRQVPWGAVVKIMSSVSGGLDQTPEAGCPSTLRTQPKMTS
jgi:hypothetical protein